MKFKKGDILLPVSRVSRKNWLNGLYHPAILWDEVFNVSTDFQGIMITQASQNERFRNILMQNHHFMDGYKLGFSSSYFVNQVFTKFENWGPFDLVGKLTSEGIEFIQTQLLSESFPIEFTLYREAIANKPRRK